MSLGDASSVERRLAAQQAVTRVIAESPPAAEAMCSILEAIAENLGWVRGAFWGQDPADGRLHRGERWTADGIDLEEFDQAGALLSFGPGEGLPGRVLATGEAAWIEDVTRDPDFARTSSAEKAGLHGAFAFPVAGRALLGVLEFFSTDVRALDQPMVETLRTLGFQVGQYLDRRRDQELVQESEARKSAILEAALDCIITMDHDGLVIEFNPAAEAVFGFTREEAIGAELADLIIPPEFREAHRTGLAHYLATGEGPVLRRRVELEALRRDGTRFPVELTITPIALPGLPVFTGYLRDITERKHAERQVARLLGAEREARAEAEDARRRLEEHRDAVRVLSTPVLRIGDRLLLLPIVGALDPARAQQLKEQVLDAVREERARAVVLDVTGIPSIDATVAGLLIGTIEAARLMGAEVVLTGMSAALSETLVTLGLDIGQVVAVGDLQGGIERAAAVVGR